MSLGRADPEISPLLMVLQFLASRGYVSVLLRDGGELRVRTIGELVKRSSRPDAAEVHVVEEGVDFAIRIGHMPSWLVLEWPRFREEYTHFAKNLFVKANDNQG